MKSCCITGHRTIAPKNLACVKENLRKEIDLAIEDGYTHFISGFAEGADLLFAAIIAELKTEKAGITLEAALPYRKRILTKNDIFHTLLCKCDFIGVISEEYQPSCFMKRNRHMVQKSSRVIAVYDGRQKGGTLSTMRYAAALECDVRPILLAAGG